MIRAFIFDIGNVILRFDFNLALQRLAQHCDPAAEAILELIEPVKGAYEGGRIGRQEFQSQVRDILRYTGSDADFISAWEDIFSENQPMIELIETLHAEYPLYLLSNTSDIHMDFIRDRYPIFSRFTDGVYSYRVRASKPEAEIYQIAIRQFDVNPAETYFIDDLAANIEAARAAGIVSHHYHHDRHADLLGDLHAHGALPIGQRR